mmetsp:Transcript_6535/g.10676  ORF Transcript_6535/g.10676 Transcript_6535/m.10676 type:complete len:386 (-) Transcript_6535:199-1356(-)
MFKLLTTAALSVVGASAMHPLQHNVSASTDTVDELDVDMFVGLWYEMYTKSPFEDSSQECVTAQYTPNNDGTVAVHNYGLYPNGHSETIDGYVYRPSEEKPGQFKLHFDEAGPVDTPYWVYALGPVNKDGLYDYAVVSDRVKFVVYVLARDADQFSELYEDEVQKVVRDLGFSYPGDGGRKEMRKVRQDASCVYESTKRKEHMAGKVAHSSVGGVETVDTLDVNSYVGRWYQMYADELVLSTIEPDAYCVTADYGLKEDGTISVHNYQTTGSPTEGVSVIDGYAYVTDPEQPGQLKVHFDSVSSAVDAPYWVLALGPLNGDNMYDWAIVSDPFEAYLFVLARDVTTFNAKYDEEVTAMLNDLGFTKRFNKPIPTYQGHDCLYEAV